MYNKTLSSCKKGILFNNEEIKNDITKTIIPIIGTENKGLKEIGVK